MKITRRKFLKSGSSALTLAAGAMLLPQIAAGQIDEKDSASLLSSRPDGWDSFNSIASLNKADFESQIGTEFNLLSDTYGHRSVSLIGVRGLSGGNSKRKATRTEGFSLLFKGSEWQDVNQDVYYVSHATLGYFYALMAPVRESKKSPQICYEAVINRLV